MAAKDASTCMDVAMDVAMDVCRDDRHREVVPTREIVSAYLAEQPGLANKRMGDLDDELIAHLEKLSRQLFGQPALV